MSPNDLDSFIVSGTANDLIYQAGDQASHVYIVDSGEIELVAAPAAGRLALLQRGDLFGEQALYESKPRNHTARALSAFRVIRLDPPTFAAVVSERPEIAVRVLRQLTTPVNRRRSREAAASPPPAPTPVVVPPAPPAAPVEPRVPPRPAPPVPATLVHSATGTRFTLAAGQDAVVGRRDKASRFVPDIDLTSVDSDRTVGRRHLRLRWRQGRCVAVEETVSANGSFVNGGRLEPGVEVELRDGDRLQLGMVGLLFEHR
jgi:hypothetical protein